MNYLKAHPIEFKADGLKVLAQVCEGCQDRQGAAHVTTLIVGPAGEFAEDFQTVPDVLNYLLHFSAQLAGNGNTDAWNFAHHLTTWVQVATSGVPRVPPPLPAHYKELH
jgi:hypothetical protein